MKRLSRRTLLAGTGMGTLVAVAGCLGGDGSDGSDGSDESSPESEEQTGWREDLDVPGSLVSALAFVYDHGNGVIFTTGDSFRPGGDIVIAFGDTLASANIESLLQFGPDTSGETVPVTTLVGEFELEPDAEGTSHGSFTLHEVDRGDNAFSEETVPDEGGTLATNGEVLLLGTHDRVIATLDSHESDQEPYLATEATARTMVNKLVGTDAVVVSSDSVGFIQEFSEDIDVESVPTPVGYAFDQAQDVVQWQLVAGTVDERAAGDLKTLGGALSSVDPAKFEHRVTDGILIVEGAESTTQTEETKTDTVLGSPVFETYDEQTGEILLRFTLGEPVPVESVTVDVDGERYEGDVAPETRDADDISRVALDADAVEPGDSMTVTYGQSGRTAESTARGRRLLTLLPVAFGYDHEERTATVTYEDGPPLPGEQTEVRASADGGPADGERVDPLSGGLTKGDTVTVSDIDPGTTLSVVYERTDGEAVVIASEQARPPGMFDIDHDSGTLTIIRERESTRPDGESLPADSYEVRIDGEPADTQWTDQGQTIEPGDTLAVGDIDTGSVVSVVWVGETTEFELAALRPPPDIRIAVSYDAAEQRLTLTHDGGESVDADALTAVIMFEEERVVSWSGDTVAEGDELTVEGVRKQAVAALRFHGNHIFDEVLLATLDREDVDEVVLGAESGT